MYVKEIIIEGFKSYAQSTTVNLFDPHFNAITGLNGSGKSNILDAICFVLGITNLTQVRATNLQELIYKGGNAGITKATVSITFNNMDKNQSPPGYQDYEEITVTRQITVAGKHKYLINGQNATAQRVADLFCSTQLNVNNPNFLIMQGKITKVLNMKPIEILSMIEEAAGTKTYDIKKSNALATIDKKNAKLNEIERVLREDITPMIEKLKQERSSYIEYQKCEREYVHLHKISLAFNYYQCAEILKNNQSNLNKIESELEKNKNRIFEINQISDSLKNFVEEAKLDMKNSQDHNILIKLEADLKQVQIEITKINSEIQFVNSNIKSERKKHSECEKSINENKSMIETKNVKLEEMKAKSTTELNALEVAETNLKKAQRSYEALCCGFVADGENDALESAQDQLLKVDNQISEKKTQIKMAEMKIINSTKESDKLEKEVETDFRGYEDKKTEFENKNKAFETLKEKISNLRFDPNQYEELNANRRKLNVEINKLRENGQNFFSRFPQLNLEYKDPEPNFDRSRVKGLVSNLFEIKDPKFSNALEVAAGGKLFNLVVDTDQTGKLILKHGELKRKITIIPMNQIRAYTIPENVVKTAKKLVGEENVFTALSLISYDPIYKPVMEFVFGSKFVCFNLEAAKKVAFHPQIMTNTITLDGDHFDPDGVLTGGSRGERPNLLVNINQYNSQLKEMNLKISELGKLDEQINTEKEKFASFNRLTNELNVIEKQLSLSKMNLEQTSHHQKSSRINLLKEEIKRMNEEIENEKKNLIELNEKKVKLTESLSNKKDLESEKKLAQKKIDEAKKQLDKELKSNNNTKQEFKSISLEIDVLNKEIESLSEELSKIETNLNNYNAQLTELNEKLVKVQPEENLVLQNLEDHKLKIREKNELIDSKLTENDKLEKEKNSLELIIKELNHKKSNLSEQLDESSHKIETLVRTNEWMNDEKEMFGKENTIYDFKKQNMKELNHRLNEIKTRKEKLSKQVDIRAMGMLAKKEEEYEELNKKRLIVLNDRSTLESTIEDLEKIKTQVLIKAFVSINKDFGNIFKTLLPGAFSKLEYVNKSSLLEGVEFKVAFGDVWKESLTELSGGQRSLVALSLILSLLLYKPAPLYILDEVDAALDTSHTQNIGLMIKKYFKHSQFIIVSLKDGMFNNANVLYRTKLIEGVSTIQRFEQKRKHNEKDKENQQ